MQLTEKPLSSLTQMTFKELHDTARKLGRVRLVQLGGGTFHARIEFETAPGVELEAKSDFNHREPEEALVMAIEKAREVRAHFK